MAGRFVVSTRDNGQFQFNLRAENGEVILRSEAYVDKAGCNNGIESVRSNSADDGRYQRNVSADGKWYFNLVAKNGQVVGTSEMYESESARDAGIAVVKSHAPGAAIVDGTG